MSSQSKLRNDTECQNCGHTVEQVYCPHCGQKNTETRQSFGHLVTHFAEDLTHYDSGFWRTIKYLLFRPARLTKQYLEGKRQSYVPPVKLYIFISFITFFLPAVLPDFSAKEEHDETVAFQLDYEAAQDTITKAKVEDEQNVWLPKIKNTEEGGLEVDKNFTYSSVKEMDSIEALKPDSLKFNTIEYSLAKRLIKVYNTNTPHQVGEKFAYSFVHNIPKALFVYLPIFAFWLWLFHGKKRWYFFDHGIFTLHYFSFLLLIITFIILLSKLLSPFNHISLRIIGASLKIILLLFTIFYFYKAHRNMYREGLIINFIKSTVLFILNFISIIILILLLMALTMYNLH